MKKNQLKRAFFNLWNKNYFQYCQDIIRLVSFFLFFKKRILSNQDSCFFLGEYLCYWFWTLIKQSVYKWNHVTLISATICIAYPFYSCVVQSFVLWFPCVFFSSSLFPIPFPTALSFCLLFSIWPTLTLIYPLPSLQFRIPQVSAFASPFQYVFGLPSFLVGQVSFCSSLTLSANFYAIKFFVWFCHV